MQTKAVAMHRIPYEAHESSCKCRNVKKNVKQKRIFMCVEVVESFTAMCQRREKKKRR